MRLFWSMENKPSRNRMNDYQVLSQYLSGKIEEDEMTEHQKLKLRRARKVYELLLNAQSNNIIVENLINDFGLSVAQAWRDLHLAEALFGNLRESNKAMKRQIAENMALETYRVAKKLDDARGMAAANKNYIEATGVGLEDSNLPDFEKLQPNIYVTVLDEDVRAMFQKFIEKSGGSLDLTKLIEKAEDAQVVEESNPRGTNQG
jgi:hypothetical protein